MALRLPGREPTRGGVRLSHRSYQGQITPAEAVAEAATKTAAVRAVAAAVVMMRRITVLPLNRVERDL